MEIYTELQAYEESDNLKEDVLQVLEDYEERGVAAPPESEIRQGFLDAYRRQLEQLREEELLGDAFQW